MSNGCGIMPLSLRDGSTMQWGMGRGLLSLALLVCSVITVYHAHCRRAQIAIQAAGRGAVGADPFFDSRARFSQD